MRLWSKCWPGMQPFKDLIGAGESSFKMTHSHGHQNTVGCWTEVPITHHVTLVMGWLSVLMILAWLYPRVSDPRQQGGNCTIFYTLVSEVTHHHLFYWLHRQILIQCGRETTQRQEVGLTGAYLGDRLPQYVYFTHVLTYFHCDIPLLFSTKSYWVSTLHIDLRTEKNTDFQSLQKHFLSWA